MFNQFEFEYPYLFGFILLFVICDLYCKEKAPTLYFPHLNIYNQNSSGINMLLIVLKYSTILFALIALSSPVKILESHLVKKNGINIVLSLDTSGSMKQIGFNPNNVEQNRWQVVSEIVQEFIAKRSNDNIGLVVFGSSVLTASPLSFDKRAQQEIIKYLDIGVVGDKTAMIDSLATSINILKHSHSKSKIIILLTDGEDTASQIPYEVINKLAIKHNIKIYAIGIGESNKILLNKITKSTGGKSFLANSKDSLSTVYDNINQLEKSKIDNNKIILKEYLFFYPLFASILSLICYIYLKNRE